jgi:signal transduction histidine kinase
MLGSNSVSASDNDSADPLACARLLSLAAHEFRTPVSVVGGYIRMLQRDGGSSLTEPQRKILDEAEKSCERLLTLIGELSEIGKLDAGAVALAQDVFDVFALVQDIVHEARDARTDGADVSAEGSPLGARVTGDRVRLRAALSSLLRAIVRERPGTPTVIVDRRPAGSFAGSSAFIVIGSAAEVAGALEAPREPLDEGRGGLGLALPIARRIVVLHGGSVWSAAAPGNPPGRGAVVVSLPCETGSI